MQATQPGSSTPKRTHWSESYETSIFTRMSVAAQKAGAYNLAQGFPDFEGPKEIIEAGVEALRSRKNQYAPSHGIAPLRQSIAEFYRQHDPAALFAALHKRSDHGAGHEGDHQADHDGAHNISLGLDLGPMVYDHEEEVTVFSGATEALFSTLQSLCQAGDEVIAFEPLYDSYEACVESAGARLIGCPLKPGTWALDGDRLTGLITPKTRAILLNTPHNPTGRVFNQQELRCVADLAEKHDLIIVADEVYEHLTFERPHMSIARLPGMRERTIVISSTAKSFSLTGWKVGFALAPKHLTGPLRTVHQFTVYCSATPLQWAMVEAFSIGKDYFEQLQKDYLIKRDLLCQGLEQAGLKLKRPEGTYFVLASVKDLKTQKGISDLEFALQWTQQAKVSAIPVSTLYSRARRESMPTDEQHWLRFAFCKNDDTIKAATASLQHHLSAAGA